MKKLLATSLLAASVVSVAFAEENSSNLKVVLGGELNSQFGGVEQKEDFRYLNPSSTTNGVNNTGKLANYSVVNDAALKVNVDGEADYGIKYGAKIKLDANTSKNKFGDSDINNGVAQQVVGYVETMFGKLQVGSYHGAAAALRVDAGTVASATGGVHGDSRFWWNKNSAYNNNNSGLFLQHAAMYSDTIDNNGIGTKRANAAKITYFTPNYAGFTLGVTWVPNLDKYGTVSQQAYNDANGTGAGTNSPFKNVWQGALRYDAKFNDWDFKAYVAGETGLAKDSEKNKRLQGFEGGLAVSYMGVKVAGSYGSQFKTGIVKEVAAGKKQFKNADYWTAGLGYDYAGVGVSVNYFESRRTSLEQANSTTPTNSYGKYNRLQNVVVGVDYALAPGFMPYAEVSFFKFKDAYAADNNKVSNKGQVYLVGTKLNF